MRILYLEEGEFPDVFVGYVASPCWHCEAPVCADACPPGAISKRVSDGVVLVDAQACLGESECGAKCRKACPYDAPQFGEEDNAKMQKCNLCADRLGRGSLPSCVEACPTRALDAGDIESLRKTYGDCGEAPGFSRSARTRPAVVFTPKKR
jgi:anaerobic dimethyl sulfoxide reductase subunit B (iron-sulfur subunit)